MNFMKTAKPTQYESVEDSKDLRIPVHSEEAFEHGINFKCKYIGTEEIPRPNSRVEIVAAMRRIRYEHKYRNIKKRKVYIDISADGIKITLRKKKKKNINLDESSLFIMHYAINSVTLIRKQTKITDVHLQRRRKLVVFYVSHDSQDLKIFSYIARGEDGIFRCCVYKSLSKTQAMNVVRTIGQAFEVCHKINAKREGKTDEEAPQQVKEKLDTRVTDTEDKSHDETDIDEVPESDIDPSIVVETKVLQHPMSTLVTDIDTVRADQLDLPPPLLPTVTTHGVQVPMLVNGGIGQEKHGAFTLQQLQQLYHQQLLQQINDADAIRTELSRVRAQLKAEMDARSECQKQVHRLLAQNREMVVSIQKMMTQVSDKHAKENSLPLNQSWMLSELLPMTTVMSTSSTVQDNNIAVLGTSNMDFDSQVFDNMNTNMITSQNTNPVIMNSSKHQLNTLMGGNFSNGTQLANGVSSNDAFSTNPFNAAPPLVTTNSHKNQDSRNNNRFQTDF